MNKYFVTLALSIFLIVGCEPTPNKSTVEQNDLSEQDKIQEEIRKKAKIEKELEESTYLFCGTKYSLAVDKYFSQKQYASGEDLFHIYLRLGSVYKKNDDFFGEYYKEKGSVEGRVIRKSKYSDIVLINFAESESLRNLENYFLRIFAYPGHCFYQSGGEDGVVDYADCNENNTGYTDFTIARDTLEFSTGKDYGWYFGNCEIISRQKYNEDFLGWIQKAKEEKIIKSENEKKKKLEQEKANRI